MQGPAPVLAFALAVCLAGASPADERTPKEELDALLEQGDALARDHLRADTDFIPFALVQPRDGEVQRVTAPGLDATVDPEEATTTDPKRALAALVGELKRRSAAAGGYRAVAIFSDDEIELKGHETSAIQAGLEHESGYCVTVFTPYSRLDAGEPVFGKAVSSPRRGAVLGSCR